MAREYVDVNANTISLQTRIRKDFTRWLDYPMDLWPKNKMTIRRFDDDTWPNENYIYNNGEYNWFGVGMYSEYENGLILQFRVAPEVSESGVALGYLNYDDIVDYTMKDICDWRPMFFCRYSHNGSPFERVVPFSFS